jgi:Holliday junction resolvase-like predicted endonuclease
MRISYGRDCICKWGESDALLLRNGKERKLLFVELHRRTSKAAPYSSVQTQRGEVGNVGMGLRA